MEMYQYTVLQVVTTNVSNKKSKSTRTYAIMAHGKILLVKRKRGKV